MRTFHVGVQVLVERVYEVVVHDSDSHHEAVDYAHQLAEAGDTGDLLRESQKDVIRGSWYVEKEPA